jgi:hypothetical protein
MGILLWFHQKVWPIWKLIAVLGSSSLAVRFSRMLAKSSGLIESF